MSEAAPERPARRENVLTRKIGPLPTWGWVAIIGGVIIGYAYYKNRQSSSSTAAASGTNASQIPQFVNQTYTTLVPPPAPVPPPSDHDETDSDDKKKTPGPVHTNTDVERAPHRRHKRKHPTHHPGGPGGISGQGRPIGGGSGPVHQAPRDRDRELAA
jgi:hypothetical protein